MGKAGEHAAAGPLQHQQSTALGRLDRVPVDQPLEYADGQGLAPGGQLHGGLGRLAQGAEAGVDQLGQPGRAGQSAPPAPDAVDLAHGAARQPAQDQLAQVQRIAVGHPQHLLPGDPVDRPTQGMAQQFGGRLRRQRWQVQTAGQAVLPQRDHRVGSRLSGPHGGEHHRQAAERELVHQHGRGVVQQVGVVNPKDQQPPAAPLGHQGGGSAENLHAVVAEPLGWGQQVGDCTKWDRGGRPGRGHPFDLPPRRLRPGEGLPGQPGLADPGGAGEHHPGAGVPEGGGERLKLGPAPDQRPRDLHAVILSRPIRPIE